jgi:hypothetical protein
VNQRKGNMTVKDNKTDKFKLPVILKWRGYDPDCRIFAFSSKDGEMFFVPLNEMEIITGFLRKESREASN